MDNNSERISKAIEDMNHKREYAAQQLTRNTITAMMSQQQIIKQAQAELARLKGVLVSITIEPVSAADIVG